jgi:hypothetical protein
MGLAEEDLQEVEVKYGVYSSKTGAGVEELFLRGDGKVVLRRTESRTAEAQIEEGTLDLNVLIRLLELLEDQRFFGLDEEQFADHPGLRRIVTVSTPKAEKQVAVDNEGGAQFERSVSAILFAASLGEPRVLERRFFQTMGPI